jgi:GTP cyclohydrolase I
LSRQLNAERFADDFAAAHPLSTQVVRDWLASERGLAATPHAQRSRAEVQVELQPTFDELPVADLIDRVEAALATPVQTAVKREDEQAFARLNAENLMFCEDAARRVAAALADDVRVQRFDVRVSHFESLHAHDAVAQVSGRGRGAG